VRCSQLGVALALLLLLLGDVTSSPVVLMGALNRVTAHAHSIALSFNVDGNSRERNGFNQRWLQTAVSWRVGEFV